MTGRNNLSMLDRISLLRETHRKPRCLGQCSNADARRRGGALQFTHSLPSGHGRRYSLQKGFAEPNEPKSEHDMRRDERRSMKCSNAIVARVCEVRVSESVSVSASRLCSCSLVSTHACV